MGKIKILSVIIALVLLMQILTFTGTATGESKIWTKTFGGPNYDEAWKAQQTSDGGFIIVGYTRSYGVGSTDVYLVKTDRYGELQWQKTFGGAANDVARCVQVTSDGGYIISGSTTSYGAGDSDAYLIKTDVNGELQWQKTYGGPNFERASHVKQTYDGGYILSGCTRSFGAGNLDVYLVKTDRYGELQWQKTYGGPRSEYGICVQQTSDGGFIIVGYTRSYGVGSTDVYLVKTDRYGELQWQKTYGGPKRDLGRHVLQTLGGGYIIAGYTESYGAGALDFYLIKTNRFGELQWEKTFGGSKIEWATAVIQTPDRGYILAGRTKSFGAGEWDVYLVKTNRHGYLQWQRTFGGPGSEWARSLGMTSDWGLVIAGYTTSIGAGGRDMLLLRLQR